MDMKSKCGMKRGGAVVAAGLWLFAAGTGAGETGRIPPTILMDGRMLAVSRQRIQAGDKILRPAYDTLIAEADRALEEGPFSVMNKTKLPASGDKHDYASYARYWWPDPTKPDGLPFIRRDGETNPDSQGPEESDRLQLESMVINTEVLGLAYFLSGEERYAEKAAQLLRVWFLDPATCMNPNLNFSQGIPGKASGTKSGVIDSRILIRAMDGAILISDSPAWRDSEHAALKAWAARFLDWLKTGELARQEEATENNHGTFFDVQAAYFALFSGDADFAKRVIQASLQRRILNQVAPDGSMPGELERTRALHYSIFNLQGMFILARMAEQVGVDLWHAGDSRIRAALDFLAPYSDPSLRWPYPDIEDAERIRLLPLFLEAADVYHDDTYRRMADKFPLAEREVRRENLVVPLMR